jgi:hypothetical protein
VERWPELARRVAAEKHSLGNHGYHHRKLHFRGPAYVRTDLLLGTETAPPGLARRFSARPTAFAAHGCRRSHWSWVRGRSDGPSASGTRTGPAPT